MVKKDERSLFYTSSVICKPSIETIQKKVRKHSFFKQNYYLKVLLFEKQTGFLKLYVYFSKVMNHLKGDNVLYNIHMYTVLILQ